MIKKVLCVCIGNGDRSPVMQAVLGMLLKNAGHDVIVESAGVDMVAKSGEVSKFGVVAAKRIGLDIAGQRRCWAGDLNFEDYDLIVTAGDTIAAQLLQMGAPMGKIVNAAIPNPWPLKHQQRYDEMTMPVIMSEMYNVVRFFFSEE